MCFFDTPILLLPAVVLWLIWYRRILTVTPLASSHGDRLVLYLLPCTACLLLMSPLPRNVDGPPQPGLSFALLGTYSTEVLLLAIAANWLIPLMGICPRDDVAERRNRPAGWVVGGAFLGVILVFVGINTSPGRLPETSNLLPILAIHPLPAMLYFFVLWGIFEFSTRCSEAITVERDGGSAVRLAALLPALGLLLGKALVHFASPMNPQSPQGGSQLAAVTGLMILLFAGIGIERTWRKRRVPGRPSWRDALIAIVYLGGAIVLAYLA
jgi:hypothetical protein